MPAVLPCTLLCLAAALQAAEPEPAASAEPARSELVLPPGFALDPRQGLVASRPLEAWGEGWIAWRDGRLVGGKAIALATRGPRAREASEDEPVLPPARGATETPLALPGSELVWSVAEEDGSRAAWGWLCVRAQREEGLLLELVRAEREQHELPRSPRALALRSRSSGVELAWDASREPGAWRVWRRELRSGPAAPAAERIATLEGDSFADLEAPLERLLEYQVERASPPSIGARARGLREPWPEDLALEVARGQRLSLLTGRVDGEREDLRIEFANQDGLQIAPGEGVFLRVLSPGEDESWSLPPDEAGLYGSYRTYVQSGRTLAVRLAEGAWARVEVRRGESGPRLTCRLELDGTRLFPRPPSLQAATRGETGVVLSLGPGVRTVPAELEGEVSLSLEREDDFRSEDWREVLRVPRGARPLHDELGGEPRLVRYRARHVLADGRRSPPSAPLEVLVGVEVGEAGARALVAGALAELASLDWVRRERARATLEHLGPLALEGLRSALSSEDAEVVGAARELLSLLEARDGRPARAEALVPARLVLEGRAAALGLGEPPWAGLLAESRLARAVAVLALDPREPQDEAWRALCGESDPEALVRLVAAHRGAASVPAAGLAALARRSAPAAGAAPPLARTRSLLEGARTRGEAARVLLGALDGTDPWRELALLAAAARLRAARASGGEEGELGSARLCLELLERGAARAEPLFVDAALQLVEDPGARLAAARELTELELSRARRPLPSERLAEASGELLAARLADLEAEGARELELVLPAGRYERGPEAGRQRIAVEGLRLRGEGEVVLRGQWAIEGVRGVVLEGLLLDFESRPGLMLERGGATLLACGIEAGNACITVSDGSLVLAGTRLGASGTTGAANGVRLLGRSLILARETLFDTRGSGVSGPGLAYLERSAIDSGRGHGVDLQRTGELYLLDVLITSEASCLAAIARGVLDGLVLDSRGTPTTGLERGVLVCHEHLTSSASTAAAVPGTLLEICPLAR